MARRKNTLKCTTDGSRIPAPPHARARATGLWWSTPTAGKCEPGAARLGGRAVAAGGASCTWRILDERERPRKIVNASCVDRHVWRVVRERAPACFSACGSPPPPAWPAPLKPHTDCELHCFYSTMCDTRPCPSPLLPPPPPFRASYWCIHHTRVRTGTTHRASKTCPCAHSGTWFPSMRHAKTELLTARPTEPRGEQIGNYRNV